MYMCVYIYIYIHILHVYSGVSARAPPLSGAARSPPRWRAAARPFVDIHIIIIIIIIIIILITITVTITITTITIIAIIVIMYTHTYTHVITRWRAVGRSLTRSVRQRHESPAHKRGTAKGERTKGYL